jgi:hypothetical protein
MLHQPKEERQVGAGDALLVERENEAARFGAQQEVGVFHALAIPLKESSAPRS